MKSAYRVRFRGESADEFSLDEEASRKLRGVLRLHEGDSFSAVMDDGREHDCVITKTSGGCVTARRSGESRPLELLLPLIAGIPLIKGPRIEWAVEKLTEAGVGEILFFSSERADYDTLGKEKIQRYRRIAESAALQSGKARAPEIRSEIPSLEKLVAEETSVIFLEKEGAASLPPALMNPLMLLAGPEGGWSPGEMELLRNRGVGFSLGKSVFRSETAILLGSFLLSRYS